MSNRVQNQYKPDRVTPPGATLLSVLESQGMTQAELAERIGKTTKTIVEIVKHGAPITPETAMELEKALGVPASFWNSRERRFREAASIDIRLGNCIRSRERGVVTRSRCK